MVGLFSLRALLVLSVALNVGLIFRPKLPRGDDGGLGWVPVVQSPAHVSRQGAGAQINEDDDKHRRVINLDHGDPTMYEKYWQQMGDKTRITISGWDSMSYFSDPNSLCWFLEPEFANAVTRLHKVVGNAVTDGHHIVVGTGSSQLFMAALFALSEPESLDPIHVVSAAPYYSSYPLMTDFLKSGLYKWGGDARSFGEVGRFIELVTSPNNPDGLTREAVVNQSGGFLIHDFAYYWPQYTPIVSAANHQLMLFTVSKSTGHAGLRIGWALVKDKEVARRMTKFIELNTIGVSKDSQLRSAKILHAVSDSCEFRGSGNLNFFEFARHSMDERWGKLQAAVEQSGRFSLPIFSPRCCAFSNRALEPRPAFAWLKCEGHHPLEDCESFLRSHNILTRGGRHFGDSPDYVRISMLDRDENFNMFIQRLSNISQEGSLG